MKEVIEKELENHLRIAMQVKLEMLDTIILAAKLVVETLSAGHKIILFGNGGSAADSQHIAAELTGRYKSERKGLPAISLTTDTSALTAIGNDFGFDHVFKRQAEALANKGDLFIGISTSGNSSNVSNAIEYGKSIGCTTIGLTGKEGGRLREICDLIIAVPSHDTPRIQEMHILIGHAICQVVDNEFVS